MIQNFLTIWIFILVLFHKISSKIFSLSFLSFIILLVGLYISYINPTKYYIEYYDKTIILEGQVKNILDIYLHIIPFFFIYYTYGIEPFFNNWKTIPSLLLIILYILIYNPSKIYHLPINEIIIISFFSIFSYILLYNYSTK